MADKTIGSLPNLTDISDDALLVVEFGGKAYNITGAQWKAYAVAAAAGVNKGDPGDPGFSPTVEITAITGGHRLTITDAEGTETADILDGADGISPTITITAIAGGHRVTVKDVNGKTHFDVLNGADGDGAGDMLKSIYDPRGKAQDIFDYVDEKYKNLSDGKDATINGVNALTLAVESPLALEQNGGTATLKLTGELPNGVKVYTGSLGTSWADNGDGTKSQTVSLSGVTAANNAQVDAYYNDGEYDAFVEAQNQFLEFITNGFAKTVAGGITFTIFGEANTVSIPIIVEVV